MPNKVSPDAVSAAVADGFAPKIWYHGTRRRFDGFRIPSKPGIDELGPGVYLVPRWNTANWWARETGFILSCVIRSGPLFDLSKAEDEDTRHLLLKGYNAVSIGRWGAGQTFDAELFATVWRQTTNRYRLINSCLSGAGFVGGYDDRSQIPDQIVVFKPEDVRILARSRGGWE